MQRDPVLMPLDTLLSDTVVATNIHPPPDRTLRHADVRVRSRALSKATMLRQERAASVREPSPDAA
jgi:hypothetical protein